MAHLFWGGVDCVELARRFGTPLYVFDETVIRARCAEVKRDFLSRWPDTGAYYASKAFQTRAMVRIVDQEGLGLDVVSLGELTTALRADFPPERIELHGNAKSEEELNAALDVGVGRIIVDSLMELEVLADIAERKDKTASILLRVTPGVDAHTHAYIATGQTGSKFGLPLEGNLLPRAVRFAVENKHIDLRGLHFHVGSQLFDPGDHVQSIVRVVEAAARLRDELGFEPCELNLGGGFGAKPTPKEPHVPVALFTDAMMETLTRECEARHLRRPFASTEAGRWFVSEAGITLYRVETIKELPGITYVAVDGGMADNPRVPLYGAIYDAVAVENVDAPISDWGGAQVSVVGKCCESGDVLIEDAKLPRLERGDLIALYNTGAYTFSMASNYNRLGRPAVVLAGNGDAKLIVERQTPDDLLLGDRLP
ncbi:MAG: diaminopimelate decarboxylase [Synergistaceae bacterium]|nr:diaminopimelate decarboxylase [Synergistaceae bacterium]